MFEQEDLMPRSGKLGQHNRGKPLLLHRLPSLAETQLNRFTQQIQ
jgi:hypothetical protein